MTRDENRLRREEARWWNATTDRDRAAALADHLRAALRQTDKNRAGDEALTGLGAALLNLTRQMPPGADALRARALELAIEQITRDPDDPEGPAELIEVAFEVPDVLPRAIAWTQDAPGTGSAPLDLQSHAGNTARLVAAVVQAGDASPVSPDAMLDEALDVIARAPQSSFAAFSSLKSALEAAPPELLTRVWPTLSRRLSRSLYRWALPDLAVIAPAPFAEQTLEEAFTLLNTTARPYQVLAPLLPLARLEEAIARARRASSTVNFGASALRALLPLWGARGHLEQALVWAREIEALGERAVTLGLLLPHAPPRDHESIFSEVHASFSQFSRGQYRHTRSLCVAALAPSLVPLGFADLLIEVAGPYPREACLAIAKATRGPQRPARLKHAVEIGAPVADLVEVADEIDPEDFFPRWCAAISRFSRRLFEAFLRDEYDDGALQYLPLTRCLGGPEAPGRLIEVLEAEGMPRAT